MLGRAGGAEFSGIAQISQNWAIGPIIVAAGFQKLLQGDDHALDFVKLSSQALEMAFGYGPHIGTSPLPVSPQSKQLLDVRNRETQVPSTPDETERVDVVGIVDAVTRLCAIGRDDEADFLVMPDHSGGDARRCCRFADIHCFAFPGSDLGIKIGSGWLGSSCGPDLGFKVSERAGHSLRVLKPQAPAALLVWRTSP